MAAPRWYDDPSSPAHLRYFDADGRTASTQPRGQAPGTGLPAWGIVTIVLLALSPVVLFLAGFLLAVVESDPRCRIHGAGACGASRWLFQGFIVLGAAAIVVTGAIRSSPAVRERRRRRASR